MTVQKQQAIIFDIDGTAIDTPAVTAPSQALIDAASAAQQKYYLSAATGRAWSFAKPVLQALELQDPCVIMAGTQICNPVTGEIIWECPLALESARAALRILAEHGSRKLFYQDISLEDYLNDRGVSPIGLELTEPPVMINYTYVPEAEALALIEKLSAIPGIVCSSVVAMRPGTRDLHITNQEATKEHAIKELCRRLGVEQADTIGIGDGHNDLHLFNAVGTKVAVGNAVPELKERADKIIGPVTDDGLAHFLDSISQVRLVESEA